MKSTETLLVVTTESAPVSRFPARAHLAQLGWPKEGLAVTDRVTGEPVSYRVHNGWLEIQDIAFDDWLRLISFSAR